MIRKNIVSAGDSLILSNYVKQEIWRWIYKKRDITFEPNKNEWKKSSISLNV